MTNTIYEKYGTYFIDNLKDDKNLKFDIVKNDDEMFAVYIYSNLDFDPYFIRFQKDMIYIDGCVVQNEGIEFDDLSSQDESFIKNYLDKQLTTLKTFLKNCMFFIGYKNNEILDYFSTDVMDRKREMENFDIRRFFNEKKFKNSPSFEEFDHAEIRDFYDNIIYEYNAKTKAN